MLCRALLTALAVSCTLSIHAHAQGTQRLSQIKDLICVLLLSGLQKEDLDVSMLRKLQRYNVNIDDMNNEQQRSECLSRDKSIRIDGENDHNITTTTEEPTTTKNQFQTLNMETVLNYLITERKAQNESTTYARYPIVTKQPYTGKIIDTTNAENAQSDIDINMLQRYIKLANKTDDTVVIKTTAKSTDHSVIQNNLSTEQEKMQSLKDEFINKLFKNYFLQRQIITTTTQYTTKRTFDMSSIYKKIDEFIANSSKTSKPNQERYVMTPIQNNDAEHNFEDNIEHAEQIMPQKTTRNENNSINNIQDFLTAMNRYKKFYPFLANNQNKGYSRNKVHEKRVDNIIREQSAPREKQILKNDNQELKTIQDFFTVLNKFKTLYPFLAYSENNDAAVKNNPDKNDTKTIETKQDLKTIETVTENNKVMLKEIKNNLLKLENILPSQQTPIPSDLVKEIAETVKEAIIKDLRKEISLNFQPIQTTTLSTTISTTSEKVTTTFVPATTQATVNRNGDNIAIVDKFMELFQQIKSMQQNTFVLKINNYSDTTTAKQVQNFKTPAIPQVMQMSNYNGLLRNPEAGVPFLPVDSYNMKQMFNANSLMVQKRKYRPSPLTIQTNSVEIQPLAVPITKPQSLINQNIIVPPTHEFELRHEHNSWQPFPSENRYTNMKILDRNRGHKVGMKRHDNFKQLNHPIHLNSKDPKHYAEDIIRFRIRNNGDSKFDTDYYEKINLGNYKPNPNANDENLMYGNRDTPRFHERLEHADERVADITNREERAQGQNDDDIPSRQQLSLTDMKKGSSYDDTHFKNFLNTQQKVTDMLEKILANKPKTNTPRSVETT